MRSSSATWWTSPIRQPPLKKGVKPRRSATRAMPQRCGAMTERSSRRAWARWRRGTSRSMRRNSRTWSAGVIRASKRWPATENPVIRALRATRSSPARPTRANTASAASLSDSVIITSSSWPTAGDTAAGPAARSWATMSIALTTLAEGNPKRAAPAAQAPALAEHGEGHDAGSRARPAARGSDRARGVERRLAGARRRRPGRDGRRGRPRLRAEAAHGRARGLGQHRGERHGEAGDDGHGPGADVAYSSSRGGRGIGAGREVPAPCGRWRRAAAPPGARAGRAPPRQGQLARVRGCPAAPARARSPRTAP